jgi:hypothetical protein
MRSHPSRARPFFGAENVTPRSIRRAAERKARKLARKADKSQMLNTSLQASACADEYFDEKLCFAEPEAGVPTPISAAQLAANRANAQLSRGPKTSGGKATASLNAVKTALTGRTVLLAGDDAAEYERHIRAYQDELKPVGQRESDLVQSIADTTWRLRRIPALEAAIFARGHVEFAESFNEHDPSLRSSMIELQTFLKYEKQLRNLQLQEARLARRREKETAELRKLQQERKAEEAQALDTAARQYVIAKERNQSFEPAANGFEFSIADIERYLESLSPARLASYEHSGDSAIVPKGRMQQQAA